MRNSLNIGGYEGRPWLSKEAEVSVGGEEDIAVETGNGELVMEGGAPPDGLSIVSSSPSPRAVGSGHFRIPCFKSQKRYEGPSRAREVFGIRSKPRVSGVV